MKKILLLLALLTLLSVGAVCAADDEFILEEDPFAEEEVAPIADPLESVNRGIFWVNDKLYVFLFKPVARGLRVVPEPIRISTSNVFSNLGTPVRAVNNLLQLKIVDTLGEITRFIVNSTIGIAGLFDPAAAMGVPKKEEDFGQTLGHYGIGQGFYLVLPVLGPSSLRDGVGRVGDYFADPLTYLLSQEELLALRTAEKETELSLDKDTYDKIRKHELDPYLFVRNAYIQLRAAEVEK
ncbi:MAG: VacJ family lipoprotein [Desulfuromonadaceae bacterium]